jgi:hypothetical protein
LEIAEGSNMYHLNEINSSNKIKYLYIKFTKQSFSQILKVTDALYHEYTHPISHTGFLTRIFVISAILEMFLIKSRIMRNSETPMERSHFIYLGVHESKI